MVDLGQKGGHSCSPFSFSIPMKNENPIITNLDQKKRPPFQAASYLNFVNLFSFGVTSLYFIPVNHIKERINIIGSSVLIV